MGTDTFKEKGMASQFNGLARRHAQVLFDIEQGHHGHPDDKYRNTEVRHDHAVVTAAALEAQVPPDPCQALAVAEPLAQPDRQRGGQPHGQHNGLTDPQRPAFMQQRQGGHQAGADTDQEGDAQLAQQLTSILMFPARQRCHAHQQDHEGRKNNQHGGEPRKAHRDFAPAEGVIDQRGQGAQQDEGSDHHQQQIIAQQQRLPGDHVEASAAADVRCPPGIQRQRPANDDAQEHQDEQAARRVGGEGMHRGQHPGAHQEGAQQAQGEGQQCVQHRPALEGPALLGHSQGMDQGRAGQPGHEGGILHRVPEPPAAPAQLVVGPPAAQGDTNGQEYPGYGGPGTRPARPGRVQLASDQGGDGETEGDRQAHITHVEHGRVHRQAEVLQQRIQIPAFRRHREAPFEGIGGEQQEANEADADHAHDGQHPRQHYGGQVAGEQRDRDGPATQDQRPQQQRTLVRPPHGGHLVEGGQLGIAVAGHIQYREVIGQEGVHQAGKGHGDEKELAPGGRPRQGHPARRVVEAADHGKHRQHQRQGQPQGQGEVTELGDHWAVPPWAAASTPSWCAVCSASATSGGM